MIVRKEINKARKTVAIYDTVKLMTAIKYCRYNVEIVDKYVNEKR